MTECRALLIRDTNITEQFWTMSRIYYSTGGPRYMRSFYLRIWVYAIKKGLFSGTYPLIYSDHMSFYIRIHYMRAYFWSPYLSNITRSTCTTIQLLFSESYPGDLQIKINPQIYKIKSNSFFVFSAILRNIFGTSVYAS